MRVKNILKNFSENSELLIKTDLAKIPEQKFWKIRNVVCIFLKYIFASQGVTIL
jgi:hypothetical protein